MQRGSRTIFVRYSGMNFSQSNPPIRKVLKGAREHLARTERCEVLMPGMHVYIAESCENRRRCNTNNLDRVVKCGLLIRGANGRDTHVRNLRAHIAEEFVPTCDKTSER